MRKRLFKIFFFEIYDFCLSTSVNTTTLGGGLFYYQTFTVMSCVINYFVGWR